MWKFASRSSERQSDFHANLIDQIAPAVTDASPWRPEIPKLRASHETSKIPCSLKRMICGDIRSESSIDMLVMNNIQQADHKKISIRSAYRLMNLSVWIVLRWPASLDQETSDFITSCVSSTIYCPHEWCMIIANQNIIWELTRGLYISLHKHALHADILNCWNLFICDNLRDADNSLQLPWIDCIRDLSSSTNKTASEQTDACEYAWQIQSSISQEDYGTMLPRCLQAIESNRIRKILSLQLCYPSSSGSTVHVALSIRASSPTPVKSKYRRASRCKDGPTLN